MRTVPTIATAMMLALAAGLPARTLSAQAAVPTPAARAQSPASPAAAPATVPFGKAEADLVVRDLAQKLEDNFVFPDVAKRYAAMLRDNLAAGKYATFPDAATFAKAVTDDLQAIHKDGHLKLVAPTSDSAGVRRPASILGPASGVIKSGWIAPGVAYISFSLFPGNEATLKDLRAFLETHASAKTLIIDARQHRGGGIEEMNLIFPQLFTKETVLVDMDTRLAVAGRMGALDEDDPYFRKVASPDTVVRQEHFVVPAKGQGGLAQAKVYLLTSHFTASAGEHLAMSLKRTHRATLVGETTRGAGNYGMFMPISGEYRAFIPFGRTFDPDSGEGWEGVGVKPDIEVPSDKALDEALRSVGVNVKADIALASLR